MVANRARTVPPRQTPKRTPNLAAACGFRAGRSSTERIFKGEKSEKARHRATFSTLLPRIASPDRTSMGLPGREVKFPLFGHSSLWLELRENTHLFVAQR